MSICSRLRLCAVASLVGFSSASFAGISPQVLVQVGAPQTAAVISPPTIAPTVTQACVLHVWPASDARSSYSGWFHGGAVDGDKRGIKGYPIMHATYLSTAVQSQILSGIDWADLRSMPGLKTVIHAEPPPPQDDLARATPLTEGPANCYDELLVHSVLVEGAAFSSKSVRLMIIAKRWRAPESRPATYGAMSLENVDLRLGSSDVIEATLKSGFVSALKKYLRDEHFLRR